MKTTLKRILKFFVIIILLVLVLGVLVIRTSWAQSKLTSYFANGLSKDLNTVMTVGSVDIELFKTLVLEDVYIEDEKGDTLIFIGKVEGDIQEFSASNRQVHFSELTLHNAYIRLVKEEGSDAQNIDFLSNYFKKEKTEEKGNKGWDVNCDAFIIENAEFIRHNFNDPPKLDRVDFAHLHLHEINGRISEINLIENEVECQFSNFSLKTKKGFEIEKLEGKGIFSEHEMDFQEMSLETERSSLHFDFAMKYHDLTDFKEFVSKIWMRADVKEGHLHLSDLGYFAPHYRGLNRSVSLSGIARGEVDNLRAKGLELRFGEQSVFRGDISLSGLPAIETTFIDLDVTRFTSSMDDLRLMPIPGISGVVAQIPERFLSLGHFWTQGEFTGFVNDFVLRGNVDSELGDLKLNLALVQQDAQRPNTVSGAVSTEQFDIGALLKQKDLKHISADVNIEASGSEWNSMAAIVEGMVHQIEFRGFTYEMIEVDGELSENLFNGELYINQPEISMDFKGVVDLRESKPKFDFVADLYEADLSTLGFAGKRDSTSLTGVFDAKFTGDDADNFDGQFDVSGLSYCEGDREFYFEDFNILSKRVQSQRFISLRSNQIDMDIEGFFSTSDVMKDIEFVMQDVLPAIYDSLPMHYGNTLIHLSAELKEAEQITEIFLPDWVIGTGTTVDVKFDMAKRFLHLDAFTDSMSYKGISVKDVSVDMEKNGSLAYLSLENKLLQWEDSIRFRDNYFSVYATDDSVEADLTWSIVNYNSSGSFSLNGDITGSQSGEFVLNPSQIVISDNYWMTNKATPISVDGFTILVDDLEITNGLERMYGSGEISNNPESEFIFEIEEFQLEHLNKFLPNPLFSLDGTTNVNGTAKDILNTFSIESDMTVDELYLGGEAMGDLTLNSAWSKGNSALNILGALAKEGQKSVTFQGNYFPESAREKLDAKLLFSDFDLQLLNRLNSTAFSGVGGRADGELIVNGDFLSPEITGELFFKDATIHMNYLNTTYTFSNEVIIRKDWMGFDHIPFKDEYGNTGFANGTVIHDNYRDWNYDISAEFSKLLVLNTSGEDNGLYHGTVFASGDVAVSGYDQNVDIEITGRTESGTTFELPLGGSEEVQLESFVSFVNPNAEQKEKDIDLTGVNLNMNVEVTPDALMKVIFDEKIGDVIEGRGEGNLTMTYNQQGELGIFGRIVVKEGDYLFTLQNVIAKGFTLENGGTIEFFGDPYQAELDLKTVYGVRTSLYDIMYENPEAYKKRVPVDVGMALTGGLLNPEIGFSIELPTVDPDVESIVQSRINNEQELNKQVFALLVLNKFLPPESGSTETTGASVVTNTGTEFVASQLSNWFSQISKDVDIGLNYRPGDNISSEEWAVALSTQLFNDRLLLSGNIELQNNSTNSALGNSAKSFIGDFTLEYMITPDGRMRLKVFNESNDRDYLNYDQSATTQGVGLIFQREFDGLFDDRKKTERALSENKKLKP